MKKLSSGLLVLGLAFAFGVGATGCKKGTTNNSGKSGSGGDTGKVTYKLETQNVNLEPGERETITVTRTGPADKLAEQAIETKIEGDNPSKIAVKEARFSKDGKEVKIEVKAPGDATPGAAKLRIKVGDLDSTVTVTVKKKEGGGGDKNPPQKTTYKVEPTETAVEAGKTVEIKVSREGGKLEAGAVDAKVEGNDKVSIEKAGKFDAKGTEATVVVKVDAKATGTATVKITVGDWHQNVKIVIGKAKAGLTLPSREFARGTPEAQILPQARAAVRRDPILFTRES